MIKLTQESSLECKEIECNLIEDDDDEYYNNIVRKSNQVIVRIRINDGMNDEKLNWKWKRTRKWKWKWKKKWQKEKYSKKVKVKMKKKIASMIMNATKAYPTSEKDVRRDNETKGTLKMIDRRQLTKKKRVSNQWPDHPT